MTTLENFIYSPVATAHALYRSGGFLLSGTPFIPKMTVGKPLSRIIFRSVLVTLVLWYLYVFSQLLVYQTQPKEIVSLKASFQKNMELSRREQITNDITTLKTDVVNLAKGIVDSEDVGTKKQKLQDKLDNIYLTKGRPYQGELWEISDHTPQWMKGELDQYFSQRENHSNNDRLNFFFSKTIFHGTRKSATG